MFNRAQYKKSALKMLKHRWGFPLVLTAILIALTTMLGFAIKRTPSFLLLIICISGILLLAYTRIAIKLIRTTEQTHFSDFFTGLEHWLSGALAGVWFALWVFLWSLLYIIPGIIKAIAYSQMFFILAEHPHITVRKAMQISKVITRGHKGDLFTMYASFFGWILLCTLSGGIGYIWLLPYMTTTCANAYAALKDMAIMSNTVNLADFASADDEIYSEELS